MSAPSTLTFALAIYAALVATYAATVATGSLIVAYREHRASGHRLRVSTSLLPRAGDQPAVLLISVTNDGRGDASVARVFLNAPGPFSVPLTDPIQLNGPELPHKISGTDGATWTVDVDTLLTVMRRNGWGYWVRGVIYLTTGDQVWENIERYTVLTSG